MDKGNTRRTKTVKRTACVFCKEIFTEKSKYHQHIAKFHNVDVERYMHLYNGSKQNSEAGLVAKPGHQTGEREENTRNLSKNEVKTAKPKDGSAKVDKHKPATLSKSKSTKAQRRDDKDCVEISANICVKEKTKDEGTSELVNRNVSNKPGISFKKAPNELKHPMLDTCTTSGNDPLKSTGPASSKLEVGDLGNVGPARRLDKTQDAASAIKIIENSQSPLVKDEENINRNQSILKPEKAVTRISTYSSNRPMELNSQVGPVKNVTTVEQYQGDLVTKPKTTITAYRQLPHNNASEAIKPLSENADDLEEQSNPATTIGLNANEDPEEKRASATTTGPKSTKPQCNTLKLLKADYCIFHELASMGFIASQMSDLHTASVRDTLASPSDTNNPTADYGKVDRNPAREPEEPPVSIATAWHERAPREAVISENDKAHLPVQIMDAKPTRVYGVSQAVKVRRHSQWIGELPIPESREQSPQQCSDVEGNLQNGSDNGEASEEDIGNRMFSPNVQNPIIPKLRTGDAIARFLKKNEDDVATGWKWGGSPNSMVPDSLHSQTINIVTPSERQHNQIKSIQQQKMRDAVQPEGQGEKGTGIDRNDTLRSRARGSEIVPTIKTESNQGNNTQTWLKEVKSELHTYENDNEDDARLTLEHSSLNRRRNTTYEVEGDGESVAGASLPTALRCPTCCRFHFGLDCGPAPAPCVICGEDHWVKQCNAQAKEIASIYRPGVSCKNCRLMHKGGCPAEDACPICLRNHIGLCLKPSGTCRYCGGQHWENGCSRWQALDEEMGYSGRPAEPKGHGMPLDMASKVLDYFGSNVKRNNTGSTIGSSKREGSAHQRESTHFSNSIRSQTPLYTTAKSVKRGSIPPTSRATTSRERKSKDRDAERDDEDHMSMSNAWHRMKLLTPEEDNRRASGRAHNAETGSRRSRGNAHNAEASRSQRGSDNHYHSSSRNSRAVEFNEMGRERATYSNHESARSRGRDSPIRHNTQGRPPRKRTTDSYRPGSPDQRLERNWKQQEEEQWEEDMEGSTLPSRTRSYDSYRPSTALSTNSREKRTRGSEYEQTLDVSEASHGHGYDVKRKRMN